jgi:hypothetical protein
VITACRRALGEKRQGSEEPLQSANIEGTCLTVIPPSSTASLAGLALWSAMLVSQLHWNCPSIVSSSLLTPAKSANACLAKLW